MMKIEFSTSGAAFEDQYDSGLNDDIYKRVEVNSILVDIQRSLSEGSTYGKCVDCNGNTVGEWSLT